MRAAQISAFGDETVLEVETVDRPSVGDDEVLVDVDYCSLNNRDRMVRSGTYSELELPYVPGSDIAGTVLEVGSAVDSFERGDRVTRYTNRYCGQCQYCKSGDESSCEHFKLVDDGYAELVAVPADILFKIPDAVPLTTAACLPSTYLTAWHALAMRGAIRPGESVLVLGGSGGFGSACVQLADEMGARPIGVTSSTAFCERLNDIGAAETINRLDHEFDMRVLEVTDGDGVHVVVDSIGSETLSQSVTAVADRGRVMVCGRMSGQRADIDLKRMFYKQIDLRGVILGSVAEFEALLAFVADRGIEPPIDDVFPLEDVHIAHRTLAEGEFFGQLLLEL